LYRAAAALKDVHVLAEQGVSSWTGTLALSSFQALEQQQTGFKSCLPEYLPSNPKAKLLEDAHLPSTTNAWESAASNITITLSLEKPLIPRYTPSANYFVS
jgi:hypothetical protein